jgi:GAF domain-containing protein
MPIEVSAVGRDQSVEELRRELAEAREQLTATSEILHVISTSPTDLKSVLDAVAENAARICAADDAHIWQREGEELQVAASYGMAPLTRRQLTISRQSVVGRAVHDQAPVHVEDLAKVVDTEFPDSRGMKEIGNRAILAIPLLRKGEVIGAIMIRRKVARPFADAQIALLRTFADQAVIAIQNTRLFDAEQASKRELQQSLEYQTATSEVLGVISRSPINVQPVFETIARSAAQLCSALNCFVYRFDGNLLHFAAADGLAPEGEKSARSVYPLPPGRASAATRAILNSAVEEIPDVEADLHYEHKAGAKISNYRSIVAVPMLKDGSPIGAIAVTRSQVGRFPIRQIELLQTFADQAVIAIENTRLFEEVQTRTRELTESLEYQTAISEVLAVISRSPTSVQPVFDTIAASALRLCGAKWSVVTRFDGQLLHLEAHHNLSSPTVVESVRRLFPRPLTRGGPTDRAIISGTVSHVSDVLKDPEYTFQAFSRQASYRSHLAVPMMREERAIGAITVAGESPAAFSNRQVDLLKAFAAQAVIAIDNTRLFEAEQTSKRELQESLEYQTATAEVLSVISRSPNELQPVLDAITQTAARLCQADYAHFRLLRDGAYHVMSANNYDPRTLMRLTPIAPGPGSITGRAAIECKTVHLPDIFADATGDYSRQYGEVARTGLGVPLVKDGTAVGVIMLFRKAVRPFTERQIALVNTFAEQALIAMENTRLFEEVQSRTHELQESLEYQAATSDVLNVISRSPNALQPVLDTIVATAQRLCGTDRGSIWILHDHQYRLAASIGNDADTVRYFSDNPISPSRSSLIGRVALTNETVHVRNVLEDVELTFPKERPTIRPTTMLGVPLMRNDTPIGVIGLSRVTGDPFTEKQIALVETFAEQAVIAIENTRLFEEVQARNRDLTALSEVGRAVSSTLDLKVVLKTIVDRAVHLSGTDAGSLFYYRKQTGRFELGETTGLDEEVVARFRKLDISANEGGLGEATAKRQPVQIADLMQRPSELLRDAVIEAGFRASLIVPLLSPEGALGALVLRRRQPGEFTPSVISLMQSFADQSAIALENARLFEEIAQKSRELEIASQHKSQFVANMSHELRTPLAAILGYAELMQEGFYEPQGPKSLDALTRIRSNGKHLLGLINTVLDIAKIESGQFSLNLGEYALENVVETVRAATEALAETKKLGLKTEVPGRLPVGVADEQRLTQVLLNLVGNAIKFTDKGEVRISATTVNSYFAIRVTDTGPGIPIEEQKRIFEQFHQIDSSNTKSKGGTGLGLAIAKQIVEMHGGRIWVESTPGEGATFQMELPILAENRKATE